jgi:1-hydroxycarotenoid 3,4-desaturase
MSKARGPRVIVVGAGLGGLAAAIELAHAGCQVRLQEALDRPGGKAGVVTCDGVELDSGPSLLTLPDVAFALLDRLPGGRDRLKLRRPSPAFRYLYVDGAVVDVFVEPEATLASVRAALGAEAADDLQGFLDYSRQIWEAAAPPFVFGPAPELSNLFGLAQGWSALGALRHIDPLRTMKTAIHGRIRSPHLRMLLERYATYNGSDVRAAPATLNCIAHVELALGGFGVEGGIGALIEALTAVAVGLGVELHLGAPVAGLRVEGGRARGIRLPDGAEIDADAVVVNADVASLSEGPGGPEGGLLPAAHRGAVSAPATPSMSGWTALFRARRRPDRVAHTVLFPADYGQEMVDLFDRGRPPEAPTVYVCAQAVAHGRAGWAEEEPLFVMINAPAEPRRGPSPTDGARLCAQARQRLEAAGLLLPNDRLLWERAPAGLAAAFPGSRGAIYGAASNSPTAAFARPANRVRALPGLYLASGGAHPGGGMPLVMMSGRLAAAALLEDHPAAAWSRP